MGLSDHGFFEYRSPDGERWRIDAGRELLNAFAITGRDEEMESEVVRWHEALSAQVELWKIVCRMYAVNPMFGVEDPDEMQPWKMEDIAKKFDLTVAEVEAGFGEAKAFWRRWQKAKAVPLAVELPDVASEEEMDEAQIQKLLLANGFVGKKNPAERRFMAMRVKELEQVLENDTQRSMARALIEQEANLFFLIQPKLDSLNERINADTTVGGTKELEDRLGKLLGLRNNALGQIESTMKAIGITEAQTSSMRVKSRFRDCLAVLIQAVAEYEAKGERELLDGVFTAAEVEVLTQEFTSRPFQYRPDVVMVVPDCIEGLFNPDFEVPKIKRRSHRRLVAGFRQGLALARDEAGEAVGELDPESLEDRTEAVATQAEQDGDRASVTQGMDAAGRKMEAPTPAAPVRGPELSDF